MKTLKVQSNTLVHAYTQFVYKLDSWQPVTDWGSICLCVIT